MENNIAGVLLGLITIFKLGLSSLVVDSIHLHGPQLGDDRLTVYQVLKNLPSVAG